MARIHSIFGFSMLLAIAAVSGCDSSSPTRVMTPAGSTGSQPGAGGGVVSVPGGSGTVPGTGTTVTPPVTNPGTTTPAVNSPPMALPDVATVQLNSTGNPINVLANDRDANADALKITAASIALSVPPSTGGTVTIAPDALTLRYTPPQGFVGSQTVSYTISDGKGGVASSQAVIAVTPLAIPPVAVVDAFSLKTDGPAVSLDVLSNDVDGAGGGLTLVSASSTATVPPGNAGSLSVADNRLKYQPKAGFTGVETLLYTLRDANGATATAVVTITVLPLAAPPVAVPDVVTVAMGTAIDIDVLANDVDLAGGGLKLTAVAVTASVPPANGTFTVVNNRVRYTPPSASFVGNQTATYTLTDANGQSATGALTIVVTPAVPAVPPVAVADVATLAGGTTTANLNVLANDIDPAGGGLTISSVGVAATVPPDATVTATTDGKRVQLKLPAAYVGIVTLSYTITDANGSTASAAAVVTVQPAALPPTPPVLVPDVFTTAQDAAASLVDVLANDVDASGGGLTLTAATVSNSLPAGTHAVDVVNNKVQFKAAAGYAGIVTIGYSVKDANGATSTTGVLTVTVTPKLPTVPPVALADTATVSSGAGAATIGVVANDIDSVGGGLTLTMASVVTTLPPNGGSVAISNNAVRYTPATAYAGVVTVSYVITDSVKQTATGTLVITVVP